MIVSGLMAKRKQYDWESIEREYRLGQKSMRALSEEFGPNISNISRHAKKHGWVQDKSKEVRQRTNATLIAQQKRNNEAGIKAAVQTNIEVITGQRVRLSQGQIIVGRLFEQLHEVIENRDEIEKTIREETGEDGRPNYAKRAMMLKAVSLPSHAAILKNLASAIKDLNTQERLAFNIDDNGSGETIEDIIKRVHGD